ncbi:MAG: DNA polymerase domain-containing protein [Candidatus Jordarchaeales archaeon]
MNLSFWVLDVGQKTGKNPRVLLWGINDKGERVLVFDTFTPHLYIIPKPGVSVESLLEAVKSSSIEASPITAVNVVERRLLGKPVKCLMVSFEDPDYSPHYARKLERLPGVEGCFEADIRFYTKYLNYIGVTPCCWHTLKVSPEGGDRYKIYVAETHPKPSGEERPPHLKLLGFKIDVYSPTGSMNPEIDPVILISTVTGDGLVRQFEAEGHDDRGAIKSFVSFVSDYDPDVIVGFYSNFFDLQYLINRAKHLGVKFTINRDGSEPHVSVYGHVSVVGRAHIDLYDAASILPEVKLKTLRNIADYLKVEAEAPRVNVDFTQVPRYWDTPSLKSRILEASRHDVELILGIAEKLLPTVVSMSQVSGMPLDQVMRAGVGFRVENMLMREAHASGELVPARVERARQPYVGGYVLEPKPGIYRNVAVLDFASMYPNIMIKFNVSPDTYVSPDEKVTDDEVHVAPEVNHRFRKEPPGFYKRVLEKLIKVRREIRERMKKISPGSPDYHLLDERQRAVKTMTNAVYGYCGWTGAKWYLRQVAEATAAWGRETIKKTIEIAEKHGLKVLYADTDSVFINNVPEKVEAFSREVESTLSLEMKPDKTYVKVFFSGAKKRYAGLLDDGTLDVVGFEVVRGDWPEIAREVQEKVIEIVLRSENVEEAVNYVRSIIEAVAAGQIPLEKLVVWETLTKSPGEYKVKAPHIVAATRLIKAGGRLEAGSKIGYIITKGSEKISDRAYPYSLVEPEQVDTDYYITNQVIPAAMRVLEHFGVKEEALLKKKAARQAKLL